MKTLVPSAPELRKRWEDPSEGSEIIKRLQERGADFDALAEVLRAVGV